MHKLLCLVLLAGCANGFGGTQDAGVEAAVNACDPLPTNGGADAGVLFELGEPVVGKYCKTGGPNRAWFQHIGAFPDHSQFRLKVVFDRGSAAEDLDFALGRINNEGNGVVGNVIRGNCHNPSGQPEDCVTDVPAAMPDGGFQNLWVVAYPQTGAEAEVFRLTVTKEEPRPQ